MKSKFDWLRNILLQENLWGVYNDYYIVNKYEQQKLQTTYNFLFVNENVPALCFILSVFVPSALLQKLIHTVILNIHIYIYIYWYEV